MAASGSNHIWAIQEETTQGVLPSPFTPTTMRILEGADAVDNRSSLVSSELTGPSRQILSSTLGAQNPAVDFGVEHSFSSFDLLLESALQNSWVGYGYGDGITIDVGTGGVLTTDGGETWDTYNFDDGDYITVTGLTASTEDGIYKIASGASTDEITLTTIADVAVAFTAETDATLTLIGGRQATTIDTSVNGLSIVASTSTITAASDIWTELNPDLRYNDLIYLSGFANAANNGYFKVLSASATELVLDDSASLTDETISSGSVLVANNTAILTVSNVVKTFSIVSGYTDILQYRTVLGNQVSSMGISFATDSIVSGNFSTMGTEISDYTTVDPATSYESSTDTAVFNTFRGFITFNDSAPACLLNLDISLDNNSQGLLCLFTKALDSIVSGKSNVSGSFTAYFSDSQLANLYANEESVNIYTVMEDGDGNSMGIGIPKAQLQSDSNQINETTVEESLSFQSLGGDENFSNLYLINSRQLPA